MSTVLEELGPDGPLAYYVLEPNFPIVLGRSRGCGIRLEDRRVSREHCVVSCEDGRWFISDKGSRNGTWVNDQQITKCVLEDGHVITIGRVQLHFRLDMPRPDQDLATDLEAKPPPACENEGKRTTEIPADGEPFKQ